MTTGKDIIAEARKYLRTPFHHQGRLKGIGIDCVGLLVCVGRTLGLLDHDNATYPRQPDGWMLIKELESVLDVVASDDIQVGDVLVFWLAPRTRQPQHLAFYTGSGMIHTYANVSMVVEQEITDKWLKRLWAVYRFRGMSDG